MLRVADVFYCLFLSKSGQSQSKLLLEKIHKTLVDHDVQECCVIRSRNLTHHLKCKDIKAISEPKCLFWKWDLGLFCNSTVQLEYTIIVICGS